MPYRNNELMRFQPKTSVQPSVGARKFAKGYQGTYQSIRKTTPTVVRKDMEAKYDSTDLLNAFSVGLVLATFILAFVIKAVI